MQSTEPKTSMRGKHSNKSGRPSLASKGLEKKQRETAVIRVNKALIPVIKRLNSGNLSSEIIDSLLQQYELQPKPAVVLPTELLVTHNSKISFTKTAANIKGVDKLHNNAASKLSSSLAKELNLSSSKASEWSETDKMRALSLLYAHETAQTPY